MQTAFFTSSNYMCSQMAFKLIGRPEQRLCGESRQDICIVRVFFNMWKIIILLKNVYISSHILHVTGEKSTGKGKEKWDACEGQRLPFLQHPESVSEDEGLWLRRWLLWPVILISPVFIFTACMPLLCPAGPTALSGWQNKLTNWLYCDGKKFSVFVRT